MSETNSKFKVGNTIVWNKGTDAYDEDYSAIIKDVTPHKYIYDIYSYGKIKKKNHSCKHDIVEQDCKLLTKLERALK